MPASMAPPTRTALFAQSPANKTGETFIALVFPPGNQQIQTHSEFSKGRKQGRMSRQGPEFRRHERKIFRKGHEFSVLHQKRALAVRDLWGSTARPIPGLCTTECPRVFARATDRGRLRLKIHPRIAWQFARPSDPRAPARRTGFARPNSFDFFFKIKSGCKPGDAAANNC